MAVNKGLLEQIDRVQLSPRLERQREAFFKRGLEITGDRAVLVMESWKETEGDLLDIRWARVIQKLAERVPIVIFRDQLVVGNETKLLRGVDPWVEYEAPTVLETMEKGQKIRTSAAVLATCADEDWDAVEEAVNSFLGKTQVDMIYKSMESLYGDWPEELEKARGILRQGKVNGVAVAPDWEKLLTRGLRAIIQEAEAGLERIRAGEEPEARKAWFWQAAIICCEAVIQYAHRYAVLARDLAAVEPDPARRKELEQVAAVCERVPEYPARTLQEAVQSRILYGIAIKWTRPSVIGDTTHRLDQYFYPYFKSDLREGRVTLEEACDLIGTSLSITATRDGVNGLKRGEYAQGTMPSNVTLGGLTRDGLDANNELTYLVLHMAGLLRYAEPHYTFRVGASTPRWAMLKALETNRKVGGGQPQFMSDDRVISYLVEKQGEDLKDARDWMGQG